jgi:hypothetical protein
MDLQILRDLFDACAEASEILQTDADFRARVRQTRARLAPMQIGRAGPTPGMAARLGYGGAGAAPPARVAPVRPASQQPGHAARNARPVPGRAEDA